MNAHQRFDYWISYTTRKLNIFLGSDSIYELLLKFYDDDKYQQNDARDQSDNHSIEKLQI